MKQPSSKTLIAIIGIIIAAVLISIRGCEDHRFKKEQENNLLRGVISDTLIKKRNPDSSQVATIGLLQADKAELLLAIQTKDETIKQLQAVVKANEGKIKNGGSVSIFTTSTNYSATVSTTIQPNVAGAVGDSCHPTYSAADSTEWVEWSTLANEDSTSLHLKVKNAYSVLIGSERIGLFKRKPIVEVTSLNPYTDIRSLRAFEVKDTRKERFSFGIQMGYGVTLHGLGPYLGVGGQFKLFGL